MSRIWIESPASQECGSTLQLQHAEAKIRVHRRNVCRQEQTLKKNIQGYSIFAVSGPVCLLLSLESWLVNPGW